MLFRSQGQLIAQSEMTDHNSSTTSTTSEDISSEINDLMDVEYDADAGVGPEITLQFSQVHDKGSQTKVHKAIPNYHCEIMSIAKELGKISEEDHDIGEDIVKQMRALHLQKINQVAKRFPQDETSEFQSSCPTLSQRATTKRTRAFYE